MRCSHILLHANSWRIYLARRWVATIRQARRVYITEIQGTGNLEHQYNKFALWDAKTEIPIRQPGAMTAQ